MKSYAIVGLLAVAIGVTGQNAVRSYTPPKTAWGDPDLQGLWPATDIIGVPLERPVDLGDRSTLTDAEFSQRQTQ